MAAVNTTEECKQLKQAREIANLILDLVPVKSETLKVEDRKVLREKVLEWMQLMGEINGALLEQRSKGAGEKTAASGTTIAEPQRKQISYAEKLKGREAVVVRIEPKAKQTVEVTRKELKEKVDVCKKQIGIRNVKSGKNGAVFVECSSKSAAEILKTTVAEKMKADAREIKKSNPVMCAYGVDSDIEAEKFTECLRGQNAAVEAHYRNIEELKADVKVFRFFSTKKDNERGVKNIVFSASGKLRNLIAERRVNLMWRTCLVKDYRSIFYCFKCLETGHRAKDCTKEVTCGKCGGSHEKAKCTAKQLKCVVCEKRKIPGVSTKHEAYGKECASLKKMLEYEVKRTNYNV